MQLGKIKIIKETLYLPLKVMYLNVRFSTPSSVTTGEMTIDCKSFASAPAPSGISTTCSPITNCKYISRHKFQCRTVPARVEKGKTRKEHYDLDCNSVVPSKRRATRTLAIGLHKRLRFVDSTFGVDNTKL